VISTASLPLIRAGKVRRLYALDDPNQILIVATDAISAFDQVLVTPIPDKGAILTQLSVWWSEQLRDIMPNHLVSTDVPVDVQGRAIVAERLEMIPVECIARGYITGSGWAEYQVSGTIDGLPLPEGLQHADRLPEPVFTPTSKAPQGQHDENIRFAELVELVGADVAEQLRDYTLQLYARGARIAAERGIILADTKFEFGLRPDGTIVLADEVLTPDSSRFWDAAQWVPGSQIPSFDKQYVRDWLAYDSGWDRNSELPAPELPRVVVQATRDRYLEAHARLTGRQFSPPKAPTPASLLHETARKYQLRTRYIVDVMPKPEILDPQGKAVTGALARLGHEDFTVRQGKRFEVETTRADSPETVAEVTAFAESLLANTVIENFVVTLDHPDGPRAVAALARPTLPAAEPVVAPWPADPPLVPPAVLVPPAGGPMADPLLPSVLPVDAVASATARLVAVPSVAASSGAAFDPAVVPDYAALGSAVVPDHAALGSAVVPDYALQASAVVPPVGAALSGAAGNHAVPPTAVPDYEVRPPAVPGYEAPVSAAAVGPLGLPLPDFDSLLPVTVPRFDPAPSFDPPPSASLPVGASSDPLSSLGLVSSDWSSPLGLVSSDPSSPIGLVSSDRVPAVAWPLSDAQPSDGGPSTVPAATLPRIPAGSPWNGPYSAAAAALAGLPPVPMPSPPPTDGAPEPEPTPVPAAPVTAYSFPATTWGLDRPAASAGFDAGRFRPPSGPASRDAHAGLGAVLGAVESTGSAPSARGLANDAAGDGTAVGNPITASSASPATSDSGRSPMAGELARALGVIQATAQAVSQLSGSGMAQGPPRRAEGPPVATPVRAVGPEEAMVPQAAPPAAAPSSVVYPLRPTPSSAQDGTGPTGPPVEAAVDAPVGGDDPVPERSPFPGVATVLGARRPG